MMLLLAHVVCVMACSVGAVNQPNMHGSKGQYVEGCTLRVDVSAMTTAALLINREHPHCER